MFLCSALSPLLPHATDSMDLRSTTLAGDPGWDGRERETFLFCVNSSCRGGALVPPFPPTGLLGAQEMTGGEQPFRPGLRPWCVCCRGREQTERGRGTWDPFPTLLSALQGLNQQADKTWKQLTSVSALGICRSSINICSRVTGGKVSGHTSFERMTWPKDTT